MLLSTLISFTDVYAQSEKNLPGLSGGAAFPMGDFASTGINNESAGYANTGIFYYISYVRFLNKGFGITGMLRGQSNDLDIQQAVQKFDLDMEASMTADSKPWKNWSILAGVYNSYPIGKANKAFFESRAMPGHKSATSTEINMKFTFPDGEGYALNVKESSETASHLRTFLA